MSISIHSTAHRTNRTLVLGLDLTAAGAPSSLWRAGASRRSIGVDVERLNDLVATAERGALDFVAFDAGFRLQSDSASPKAGALDAAVIAARLAKRTTAIGLVPTIATSLIDPIHVAAAAVAVDSSSRGRGAWQVGSASHSPTGTDLALSSIRAVRRAWAVDGVPAPPIVVRAADAASLELGAQYADVVRVLARDADSAHLQRRRIREIAQDSGRDPDDVRVLVELYAVTGPDRTSAQARLELVDSIEGAAPRHDSITFVGTHRDLAELVQTWFEAGAADGFVVTPSSLQTDVFGLVDGVLPVLRDAGAFRDGYPGRSLVETLGLVRRAVRPLSLSA